MSCTSVGAHVEKEKAYSTWYSQAVSHPSTNQARPCLASEIRRDRACSGWYGRKHLLLPQNGLLMKTTYILNVHVAQRYTFEKTIISLMSLISLKGPNETHGGPDPWWCETHVCVCVCPNETLWWSVLQNEMHGV